MIKFFRRIFGIERRESERRIQAARYGQARTGQGPSVFPATSTSRPKRPSSGSTRQTSYDGGQTYIASTYDSGSYSSSSDCGSSSSDSGSSSSDSGSSGSCD